MINNNDNCDKNPLDNIQYNSEACYGGQGRAVQNATNFGASGVGIFNGKFNDIIGLRKINPADLSLLIVHNPATTTVDLSINISSTPGNSLSVDANGLYASGGGSVIDSLSPLLLMGG